MTINSLLEPVNDLTLEEINFIREFVDPSSISRKYIFGNNIYTKALVSQISVDAIIDDFSFAKSYLGIPIIKSTEIDFNCLVLSVSGGAILSVKNKLENIGVKYLDYFALLRSGLLILPEMRFNESFKELYIKNENKFLNIYNRLADQESRILFKKLVNFRFSYDIRHLEGFVNNEKNQYFEPFLNLAQEGETFLDIGCFDGYTTKSFIDRCPIYNSVHIYEPDEANFKMCLKNLAGFRDIIFNNFGLSNEKKKLTFKTDGSSSTIDISGSMAINVNKLDDTFDKTRSPTFIKIDIEGGEILALKGASEIIKKYKPKIAISVYHNSSDFWRIPELIFSYNPNYKIYLRHYTESIYETVAFFV